MFFHVRLFSSFLFSDHLVLPSQVQVFLPLEQDKEETRSSSYKLGTFVNLWEIGLIYLSVQEVWLFLLPSWASDLPHKFVQIVSFSRVSSQVDRSGSWNPLAGLLGKLWFPMQSCITLEKGTSPCNWSSKWEHLFPKWSAWRRFL